MYVPHYSIQSRCNPAVSSHLFPFPAVQHSYGDTCCQQQHWFFIAAHNPQHFQAPIQGLISQYVPLANLNITRNSGSPNKAFHIWFHGQEVWLHSHGNSDRINVHLHLPILWSHHCKRSRKNFCHSFSLSPPGTTEKLSIKSCTFIT